MKSRILLIFFIFSSLNQGLRAQTKNEGTAEEYKFVVSNSFLQLFHPSTAVFTIGLEGQSANGLAFYAEYGLPVKSFGYTVQNETKANWHYYKARLGGRYYFDPVKPYKYSRRDMEIRPKTYKNFVGVEGMVGAETFERENGFYYLNNSFVPFTKATVVILSRSLILLYGRQFKLTDRFVLGVHVGLGQKFMEVTHESVLVDSSGSSGGFGFFGFSSNAESQEGIRRVPYVKVGLDLGIRTFKRR
ncbi:MAG: hypothetical protein KDC85_07040 [Saprospiraceae bacterium]|nr:hypothetical protein [Saprospiraceae bacterium]MCB9323719.1 hypothetical protein [Lewinellaceae bacterium]